MRVLKCEDTLYWIAFSLSVLVFMGTVVLFIMIRKSEIQQEKNPNHLNSTDEYNYLSTDASDVI